MSLLEAQKMISVMSKEQPLILAYLMAVDDDILNQDARDLLLHFKCFFSDLSHHVDVTKT